MLKHQHFQGIFRVVTKQQFSHGILEDLFTFSIDFPINSTKNVIFFLSLKSGIISVC